jgi:hypothetical protein
LKKHKNGSTGSFFSFILSFSAAAVAAPPTTTATRAQHGK